MPIFKTTFTRLGPLWGIEDIGAVKNPSWKAYLNSHYGKSHWKKMKGFAKVVLENGTQWVAEIHFYTAHGKGQVGEDIKCLIERVYE